MNEYRVSVTIDLRLLASKLRSREKRFIKIDELANELGTTPRSAARILSSLAKMGCVTRWSSRVYLIRTENT